MRLNALARVSNMLAFAGQGVVKKSLLKGCVFVYVPTSAGRKISVKGALGVGGGGEEWLKTYTSVRAGDGVVL